MFHTAYIQATSGGCAVALGDSGAPFYYKDSGNNVYMRGMIILRRSDGAACFAETWNTIASTLNVRIDY